MMRSLYSGVAGLKAHQTKMDVIGNNISNVNTVGYKSQSVVFSDVLYQTTQSASGANEETGAGGTNAKQIGLGSAVAAISTKVSEAGGYQSTNNPFDIMINGDSMFVVNNNGVNYFTKAGNFTVDSAGNLVTSQGYSVMGWIADENGNIKADNVSPIAIYSNENKYASPIATTYVTAGGNINKEDESFSTIDGTRSFNVSFYDNTGYKYQATIQISQDADDKYSYGLAVSSVSCNGETITDDDGNPVTLDLATTAIKFDEATGKLIEPADGKIVMSVESLGAALPTDAAGGVTIDFSSVTCLGTETALDSDRGNPQDGTGAGRAVGNMSSVSIQKDGKIIADYDNGDQRVLAQIVVANFANLSGLEKVGDNLFAATLNSGEFNGIGDDVTSNGGYFATGVLEMSNVDLAAEFTDMITTQRGYQANSRIITVSDTMLEELINLKR